MDSYYDQCCGKAKQVSPTEHHKAMPYLMFRRQEFMGILSAELTFDLTTYNKIILWERKQ